MNKKLATIWGSILVTIGGVSYPIIQIFENQAICERAVVEYAGKADAKTLTPLEAGIFKEMGEQEYDCPLNLSAEVRAKLTKAALLITDGKHALFYDRASFEARKEELRAKIKTKQGAVKKTLEVDVNEYLEVGGVISIAAEEMGGCTIKDYDPATDNIADIVLNNKCDV